MGSIPTVAIVFFFEFLLLNYIFAFHAFIISKVIESNSRLIILYSLGKYQDTKDSLDLYNSKKNVF